MSILKAWRAWRDPLAFLERVHREHGDLAHLRVAARHVFVLGHPELAQALLTAPAEDFAKGVVLQQSRRLLGDGLLTSEEPEHLPRRRLMQPAFHRERIAAWSDLIVRHALELGERWRPGVELDLAAEMRQLTLGIAGEAFFGARDLRQAGSIGTALDALLEVSTSPLLPLLGRFEAWPVPSLLRLRRSREQLDAVVAELIAARRSASGPPDDVLGLLLESRDEQGLGLAASQVRDEVMTLLLAGHETTASGLAFAWHLLGRNPEARARLLAELEAVLGGRAPQAADVPRLAYTRQVFAEALRLFPPAWAIGRRALRDVRLGSTLVPQGSAVLVNTWALHRDPRFFDDPLRFDPSRFAAGDGAARPRGAYLPFGAGSRVCIGEAFAWTEGVLTLATLLQRHELAPLEQPAFELQARLTLRPRRGVWARVLAARGPQRTGPMRTSPLPVSTSMRAWALPRR